MTGGTYEPFDWERIFNTPSDHVNLKDGDIIENVFDTKRGILGDYSRFLIVNRVSRGDE